MKKKIIIFSCKPSFNLKQIYRQYEHQSPVDLSHSHSPFPSPLQSPFQSPSHSSSTLPSFNSGQESLEPMSSKHSTTGSVCEFMKIAQAAGSDKSYYYDSADESDSQ